MNTARNQHAADLVLKLSLKTTDELQLIVAQRNPGRPDRYLHPIRMRRAAQHVLLVRSITGGSDA